MGSGIHCRVAVTSGGSILNCWCAWFGWLDLRHGEDSENRYLLEHDEANSKVSCPPDCLNYCRGLRDDKS